MTENLKGKFITLEGPEGSGKSTHAILLAGYISGSGIKVVRTREPGGVSIAEELRRILLDRGSRISPRSELLLYAAGRSQHTDELIRPALERGDFVISERYTHASMAYQGYGRGLDLDLIQRLNEIATCGIKPDLVIVLDVDSRSGLRRVKQSGRQLDRLELETTEFHERVRQGYLEMAESDKNIVVIDTAAPQEKVHKKIIETVHQRGLLPLKSADI